MVLVLPVFDSWITRMAIAEANGGGLPSELELPFATRNRSALGQRVTQVFEVLRDPDVSVPLPGFGEPG